MVAQLNRFIALPALCRLLTLPVMAAPDGYQTLAVNGDTLVVQMAEPLPAGYQTLVVGGDTLMVQVLAEPLPTDEPLSAASVDSLSAQKRVMETSPQAAVGDSANTTKRPERHLFNSVFMGDPFQSATVSDSTERVVKRGFDQKLARFGLGVFMGTMIGAVVGSTLERDCEELCGLGTLIFGGLGMASGAIIGLGLAADPPNQAETPHKPDKARRVSVGLGPDTRGRLSAVATLRF